MQTVLTCLQELHDQRLLALAGAICLAGVYATLSIAQHAARSELGERRNWVVVSIVAAGCTAWATHMIAMLAFQPGMPSAFEPVLMAISLIAVIMGITLGMLKAIRQRGRAARFQAGLIIGTGVVILHYMGQASYLVRGHVTFDPVFVVTSTLISLGLYGTAIVAAAERNRRLRRWGGPLLLLAIVVLHVGGMASLELEFDPRVELPSHSLPPESVAPIVGAVSFSLVVLALLGLRFSVAAAVRLRRDRQRLSELANIALEGLAICDDGVIVSANESLAKLSGFDRAELVGRSISALLPTFNGDDLAGLEEADATLVGANDIALPVRVLRNEVMLGRKRQIVFAFRDQRERLRTEARIRDLAFFDPLSGLPNRAHFSDMLARRAGSFRSEGRAFVLLLVNLDRFKGVNETLGHGVGDEVLRRAGSRLRACIREGGIAGRLGGDEFALLLTCDAAGAETAAADVVELLARPFLIDGCAIQVTASVGVALAPDDGVEPEELTRAAELARSRSKEEGGNTFRFFEPEMDEHARQRQLLEAELRHALGREQFEVHYQPQVDPRTGDFQGAEALVRWNHPDRGMVGPDRFIPLAEEIGLIGAIGEWVLQTACTEAASWPNGLSVAVNLSPRQLRDRNLVATVLAILEVTGLDAHRLELEITESAIIQDDEVTYGNMRELQAAGIRVSMDDFGTGYSSLSYLRRFPFDKLKIDRSFVQSIPEDPDSVAIVQAVATLGRKLGMTVTIEGVETGAQRFFAASECCDQIQGYLISRPVPADAIRTMFAGATATRLTA
jgi:diguanylate cyclase (GGDEF)-like protein